MKVDYKGFNKSQTDSNPLRNYYDDEKEHDNWSIQRTIWREDHRCCVSNVPHAATKTFSKLFLVVMKQQ